MKKIAALVLLAIVGIAATTWHEITGTWNGSFEGPQGTVELTFVFNVDGDTLTGTSQGPMGPPIELTNGKVDGHNFSFEVKFQDFVIPHKATLNDDGTITLTVTFGGQESSMTLTRVEEAEEQ